MPIYNAALLGIDQKETRRYAGLRKAENFDESLIARACEDALLLASPKGVWEVYDYDWRTREIMGAPPCRLLGEKVGKHLTGCGKVILLAATVGEEIEKRVTDLFREGEYALSLLLDAAATTAVEQTADAMERAIFPGASGKGYRMLQRFSPGYGDWPLEQQPEILRLSRGKEIGIALSESMMLMPRKSITAIIGLRREENGGTPVRSEAGGCENCGKRDCPSRKA